MHKNSVPFFVKNLPYLLLAICGIHLVAKTLLLKHQLYYVPINLTNTHFYLTGVLILFLCLQVSLVCVDLIFHTHSTFRYVIGMNIAIIGCCLFIVGYLLGHIIEILFAKMAQYTCRQLGIAYYFSNSTDAYEPSNSTETTTGPSEQARCSEAVSLEFHEISIDLLLHTVFIPLHISATAFSWTFMAWFRKRRPEDDYE